MSNFSFLNQDKGKHDFYPVKQDDISEAEADLGYVLPVELVQFYQQIGCGFFHQEMRTGFDRLLGPSQVADITLKRDFYQHDPTLELYDDLYNGSKLIFLEINECQHLAIDKTDIEGKNAIYWFDKKIFDSLEDFAREFNNKKELFNYLSELYGDEE